MRRREFITLLGSVAAWPIVVRAQQSERIRRVGILLPAIADDAVWQDRLRAFLQGLGLLGWTIGRNLRVDTRWATPNAAEIHRHARNWLRLRLTPSWLPPLRPYCRCCRPPAP